MIAAVRNYFADLGAAVGAAWNRFWFTASPATTVGLLRVVTGMMAFYAIATYAPDLERWFAPDGMMPTSMVVEMGYTGQWSVFDHLPMGLLWPAFWASLAVLALYTLGIGGRVICIAATAVTLSYFGRTPLVTGEFETILAVLLVYLCIGRACDAFSAKSLLKRSNPPASSLQPPASPFNTIALRLLQIHIAIIHLMMGAAQLNAPEGAWWTGEGIWLAAMRPDMALVDFTFLTDHPRVVAAWSHLITVYLLTFAVFVWPRLLRPLVLAVGVLVWVSFALASGWIMFSLAMLAGLLAFVEPATLQAVLHGRLQRAPAPGGL